MSHDAYCPPHLGCSSAASEVPTSYRSMQQDVDERHRHLAREWTRHHRIHLGLDPALFKFGPWRPWQGTGRAGWTNKYLVHGRARPSPLRELLHMASLSCLLGFPRGRITVPSPPRRSSGAEGIMLNSPRGHPAGGLCLSGWNYSEGLGSPFVWRWRPFANHPPARLCQLLRTTFRAVSTSSIFRRLRLP